MAVSMPATMASHALDAPTATRLPIAGDDAGRGAEDENDVVAVPPLSTTPTQVADDEDDADLKLSKAPPRSSSSTRQYRCQAQDDVA
ncbi:hypothetical protein EJB05_42155, partial [Eragrostis curvula]